MQDRWTGKNIDLTLLSKYIEKFFKEMGYKAKKNGLMRGYKIFVIPRNTRDVVARIEIRVLGQPNDFVIDFCGIERMRSSIASGFLTIHFFGGLILRRSLKLQEVLEKLEKEFWIYLDETVLRLIDSAKHK